MISLNKQNKGFTIVELLIVIVVIGILALLVITTYSGIQAKARNTKRTSDIKSLQTKFEGYITDNGHYPSLTDMKSDAWIATNMKGFDLTSMQDPSNGTQSHVMVAAPAAKSYAYAVTDDNGASCEADDTLCTKYTLTATYEGKVNNQTTFSVQSQN